MSPNPPDAPLIHERTMLGEANRTQSMISHFRIARLIFAMAASLLLLNCARLGEAAVTFSEQNLIPAQPVVTTTTKPGMGSSGGPLTWDFWVKSRTAASDAMLGSFTPFYKLNATRIAISQHFVLYRDSLSSTMDSTQAATVLATMETAYNNLKNVYGAGEQPDLNNSARIVILAYDIQDDYSSSGYYVGGYFSPRDLYSNDFTQKLYTDPVALQQYSSLIGTLGGYSNEMSIINYDLNPGFMTYSAQVNDIVIHELSHLFTYSKRVIKQRLANHDLWIAEGIAENAPHVTIGTANVQALRLQQLGTPTVSTYFQEAPQLTDFISWATKNIAYLQSNLFFNYLRHRAELQSSGSSSTMIAELDMITDQTVNGVDTLIQKYIPGKTFSDIYADYVITHYLMLLGIPLQNSNGLNGAGTNLAATYSFAQVNIGSSSSTVDGSTIKAKYPSVIPFNFDAPKCSDGSYGLKPNSYIIFRYLHDGTDKTTVDAAATTPVAGELPIKYVINARTDKQLNTAPLPANILLHTYDAGQDLPFSTLGLLYGWIVDGTNNDSLHIIAYNPNKTGSCRKINASLISKRNHSKWAGIGSLGTQPSPDFDWQSVSGASWVNNQNGGYTRPGGIAAFVSSYPNNFLYITDYSNHSAQKLNMDTGQALGRLGRVSNTCPTSDSGWDTNPGRYLNAYCAHNFDSPRGIYVDASQNVYVADSDNRRVVKYDSSGNFAGWLGNYTGGDAWQSATTVTDRVILYNNGAVSDPRMFLLPWGITGDATYLYVVDFSGRRIIRRDRSTGQFSAYIGNGSNAWNTSTAAIPSNTFGDTAGLFRDPQGITLNGSYLFLADSLNQRIVRIDVATGQSMNWIGNGVDGWQAMGAAIGAGSSGAKFFNNPSGVASDGTYLYVADRTNSRISRWNQSTGIFAGWIGHGRLGWEMSASAPGTDPYAGVSFYPADYYSEPDSIVVVPATLKGTRNDYLYFTSTYNGRVTRVNLSCVNAPGGSGCDSSYLLP